MSDKPEAMSEQNKIAISKDNSRVVFFALEIQNSGELKLLPVLADMLEEYGFMDDELLKHFRTTLEGNHGLGPLWQKYSRNEIICPCYALYKFLQQAGVL